MSKNAVTFTPVSPRHEAALEILDTIRCCGLDEVYGGSMDRTTEKGKTFWVLTFCRARTLDGVVRVYSPNFIQVKYQQGNRKVSEIFCSTRDAKSFLVRRFVQLEQD
jgi:hypothetical protein